MVCMRVWMSTWYEPAPDDIIAYLSLDRFAQIGGASDAEIKSGAPLPSYVNTGISLLSRWCRLNCKDPGFPVMVRGKAAWAFKHQQDALLFKLTWGGNV